MEEIVSSLETHESEWAKQQAKVRVYMSRCCFSVDTINYIITSHVYLLCDGVSTRS